MKKKKARVRFGIKNVHIFPITINESGEVSYGSPIALPGAVAMTLAPVGETTPFYADDIEYFSSTTNGGYDGTLELAYVTDEFLETIFSFKKDTKNILTENVDDEFKRFAMAFEFNTDATKERQIFYNCKANRPNVEGTTVAATKEVKTQTLNLQCRPAFDTGHVKSKTTSETDETVYNNWYKAVTLPVN